MLSNYPTDNYYLAPLMFFGVVGLLCALLKFGRRILPNAAGSLFMLHRRATEVDEPSKETSEAEEEPRMEQSTPQIRRSYEKDVQRRSTSRSDKRKGFMFQESSEQIKIKDFQQDLESPIQIQVPIQSKMLSMCSVDLSVSKKQETPKNKLIVFSTNVIEKIKRDADIKFVESVDTKKEVDLLQNDTRENKEEFEFEKLQEEVMEVTRLVLQMESAMLEAKDKLTKLSQKLEDKKTAQQKNRKEQSQIKKYEFLTETLNKETQIENSDNLLEEICEALQSNSVALPTQDQFDCTERCITNGAVDEVDSEELNSRKDQTVLAVETHVPDTRNNDRDVMYHTAPDDRILGKHADDITEIITNDIKAEDKYVMSEKELLENQLGTKSARLGQNRQEIFRYDVVVDKTEPKNAHLEITPTGRNEQTDGKNSCSLKLTLGGTDKEEVHIVTELGKNHQRDDSEIAMNCEEQCTSENKFEESITKITSHERNLDSNTHVKHEQCVAETELRKEMTEKCDTAEYQFVATNQVNQYLDFSDAITRELDLKNKRQSEYYAKGWNVDVRKEVYYAENTLHEINFNMEQTQTSQMMNQDVKKNLDEACSEQRPDNEAHMKPETEIKSSEPASVVSENEDKILSVKPCDDSSKAIWGVAKLNDELLVLRDSSLSSEVWLLKEESFEYLWKLRGRPLDMAGDSRNRFLFISRCIESDNDIVLSVHEVNASKRPSEIPIHNWTVYSDRYVTLSITSESNVLLTLMKSRKLVEYTYNRGVEKVHREIEIANIANPLHAVKKSNETYVVCHGENRDEKQSVCIVNARGHLLKELCLRTSSDVNFSVVPMYLALGKGGSIIVAENRNGRVVQLKADLTVENVLLRINDGLRGPCRMHLDETNGQFVVAHNGHGWRDGQLFIRDI